MGHLHGKILQGFGDAVKYIDIQDRLKDFCKLKWDSILVCTPPESHEEIIKKIIFSFSTPPPLFVEKPLTIRQQDLQYKNVSMAACNWRFCTCASEAEKIFCGYKTTQQHAKWDLIHFLDFFWEIYGEPEKVSIENFALRKIVALNVVSGGKNFCGRIKYNSLYPTTTITELGIENSIHTDGPCNMFVAQMGIWRAQIKSGKEINPIRFAQQKINRLLAAGR